ncbi:MAG TPA: hypothetical protein VEK08_11040 [Planctomycetota bacterium]|nr:hypothetical protein [Planctomycetota bacterium]
MGHAAGYYAITRAVPFVVLLCGLRALAGEAPPAPPPKPVAPAAPTPPTAPSAVAAEALKKPLLAGFTEEEFSRFSERFKKELWPQLTRNNNSCVSCHDDESDSQLHMVDEPEGAFRKLLAEKYLDPANPSGFYARVKTSDKKKRMPKPPSKPWTEAEMTLLKNFGAEIVKHQNKEAAAGMDEQFPMELLMDYIGKPISAGPDTTFLTYYQLRRKVKTIFGDDWNRNGVDLFNENIALFGGADFVRSFNETSTASATFLSGIELMSADVASRAYLCSSGPFNGRAPNLPPPAPKKGPDGAYKKEISRLYNRILFRDPTEKELTDAYTLLQNVYRDQAQLKNQQREMRFELKVEDDSGLVSTQDFMVPVSSGECGLYQEFLNQAAQADGKQVKKKLSQEFSFRKGQSEQQSFKILNGGSAGNVSISSIELTGPLPEKQTKTILVTSPSVQIFGAWVLKEQSGFASYEDQNEDKGNASIVFPVDVEKDGKYELTVVWRKNDGTSNEKDKNGKPKQVSSNAESVLVEVLSFDATRHALEAPRPVPPKGQAHFVIDQTLSNIPYWELKTSFQFGPDDGVEINNANTRRTVVADAIHFANPATKAKFMVKGIEAEGNEKWEEFKPGQFKPYNTFGPKLLADGNTKKGELKLLYKPSIRKGEFNETEFYNVRLSCPGKAGNETQTPVIVHAQRSSPILQIRYPQHVRAGGQVTIDASASYNLQKTPLKFTWTQTGGPRVELPDRSAPTITFTAPSMSAQQAAWEGLCRALIRHPDFLFTRPPSIASIKDKNARARLQLVKIAQDLVGRTPTGEELKALEKGTPLSAFIDQYLDSKEFRDFYFHRIRLVLESHGSDLDDEPTRLWTYVCFNDLSFKEILTADYSVDKKMQKQPRPAYHGKTGLLTMKGFIDGKPGLPHFNYAAVVCEKFLGYVFEVPATIVAQREGATAASTTHPDSTCYSCHKILTPLAYQRMRWTDDGKYKEKDEKGRPIDDSDQKLVASYPFKGSGMEAFALQAQHKERFIRTMIQTHFIFYFGREMRYEDDERALYRRLWENVHQKNFSIRAMLKALMNSPEYLDAQPMRKS